MKGRGQSYVWISINVHIISHFIDFMEENTILKKKKKKSLTKFDKQACTNLTYALQLYKFA